MNARWFMCGFIFALLLIWLHFTGTPHPEPLPPTRYDKRRYKVRVKEQPLKKVS